MRNPKGLQRSDIYIYVHALSYSNRLCEIVFSNVPFDHLASTLWQVIHVRQRRRQLRDRVEAALARARGSMSTALRPLKAQKSRSLRARALLEQWLEFGEARDAADKGL